MFGNYYFIWRFKFFLLQKMHEIFWKLKIIKFLQYFDGSKIIFSKTSFIDLMKNWKYSCWNINYYHFYIISFITINTLLNNFTLTRFFTDKTVYNWNLACSTFYIRCLRSYKSSTLIKKSIGTRQNG